MLDIKKEIIWNISERRGFYACMIAGFLGGPSELHKLGMLSKSKLSTEKPFKSLSASFVLQNFDVFIIMIQLWSAWRMS